MAVRSLPARVARPLVAGRAWATDLRLGGSLLFLAGAIILMGIITAEATYPAAYTTGGNEISDLGGTRPPDSVILQPSATIFDGSMIVVGLLVMAGAWFIQRAFGRRSVTIPIAVLGAASLGVGLFPGYTGNPHAIVAMVTFVSGGVAAITGSRVTSAPFRYLSILLGAISLVSLGSVLVLGDAGPVEVLGMGGVERWIVYPVVLWVTGFGAYLAGRADGEAIPRATRSA